MWAKILLISAVLVLIGVSVLLSPLVAILALLVLIIAVFALVIRLLRRRPLRRWSIIAAVALVVLLVFTGISNALYFRGQPEQTNSPEPKTDTNRESVEQAEKRAGVEQVDQQQSEQPPQGVKKEDANAGPGPAPNPSADEGNNGSVRTVKITRIVDGDTIEISPSVDGIDTVRLIGIDAPEEKKPGCRAQPLAQAATDQLANWKGSKVKLEFDVDRTDRYRRLLAYVTAHTFVDIESAHALVDIMLNEDQLLGGFAQLYIVPPNTKYEDRLREAQEQAKKGIWTLAPGRQGQLADHGNGIGKGEGACTSEPQPQNTTLTPASSSASPNPSPNPDPSPSRNSDLSGPNAPGTSPSTNAPGTSPSTASRTAGGGDINCDQVGGPVAVPPGDPNNLDADGDGIGCEPPPD
jgi:micrococcal nuclease